ncbi:MAG TPA: PLP-dependent aminotransferase family protein [Hyphomicrobiaceae bacterium]|nr:PLP-dependent aminotransferase family protein [Hyphomicrobiaceae bacterium]
MSRRRHASPDILAEILDDDSDASLQRRVYARFASAILEGHLRPGNRLPSSRELARTLQVGRNTVMWALEQLTVEGFVEARRGAGTFVSNRLPASGPDGGATRGRRRSGSPAVRIAKRASHYMAIQESLRTPQRLVPFRMNMPAVDAFPVATWGRISKSLLSGRLAGGGTRLLGETDAAGYAPLRDAIARYLTISRGVSCTPRQVIVVAGAQQAIDLAVRVLLDPGDAVWCEDPGFPGAVAALRASGAEITAVPVDEEGMDVDFGEKRRPGARVAVVCPSTQFPLGHALSLRRRVQLIEWARRNESWIIEDDYDAEFRYEGRSIRSLQGLDGGRRVIYIGTFSKILFPGLRLAYLVVPEALVDLFVNARTVAGRHSPTLEQALVERFMTDGHMARHVLRMRKLYAERRQAMIHALGTAAVGGHLRLEPCDAGLQMLGWLPQDWSDADLCREASEAGLEIAPLSRFVIARRLPPAVLLGFGAFTPAEIRQGAAKLAAVLRHHAARMGGPSRKSRRPT